MGKRELLLIVGFVVFGAAVYSVTAPAPAPGQQGFSISQLLDHVRRNIRGNRSSAEVTNTTTLTLAPGVSEIRFEIGNAPLTVIGEDREDISCELGVWSNGFDEAEARSRATQTTLKTLEGGSSLVVGITYPEPGQQK